MRKILTITILILISLITQAATYYIDPSASQQGIGTIKSPFKSIPAIVSGNDYLIKAGTTYTSSSQIDITGKTMVLIGSYGKGVRPVFHYTGSGAAVRIQQSNYVTVENIEIKGNQQAHSLVYCMGSASQYLLFIRVQNCNLSNAHNTNNAGFGFYAWYCQDLKVLHCNVSNVAVDGFYCRYTPGIEIAFCNVYDINRRYFQNPDQKYSSGDGIQLDGNYNGFYIHHSIVQRNNKAGNKFGVILASAPGVSDNATGLIEYCTFYTDAAVTTSLHIERGNGIIVRYNYFAGVTQGIRIGGQYAKNTQIYDNTFESCSRGVGVGATYPGGYPATGTIVRDNYFENVSEFCIWTDKATVSVSNNDYTDSPGAVAEYNYGGGKFVKP